MHSWCFEDYRLLPIRLSYLLIALSTLAPPAWGHPDLMLQIEVLTAKLQLQPAEAELLVQRGDLYRRHEDFTAAAEDFTAARNIQPDFPTLDYYQGRLFLEMGDAGLAEALLSRYLVSHADHAAAWALLGQARLSLGQAEAAAADYQQAINRSEKPSPSLYRLQVVALVTAGPSHRESAREVVDTGLDHFPLEVSLLGLGTDIALAENAPEVAAGYIETLPHSIRKLARWQSRIELQQCLGEKSADQVAASACLQRAVGVLMKYDPANFTKMDQK